MREAAEWIETYRAFWSGQLDSLKRYIEQSSPPAKKPRRRT
jgi:hypothetical protein